MVVEKLSVLTQGGGGGVTKGKNVEGCVSGWVCVCSSQMMLFHMENPLLIQLLSLLLSNYYNYYIHQYSPSYLYTQLTSYVLVF